MKVIIDLERKEMAEVITSLRRRERRLPIVKVLPFGRVHCPTCGAMIQEQQRFCHSCGQHIEWNYGKVVEAENDMLTEEDYWKESRNEYFN